jgi:methyl-accepting chemotaxis protein
MKKNTTSLTNLPLSVWVLLLFLVVALAASTYMITANAQRAALNKQDELIKSEVQTAVGALQTLYDRSQKGEIALAYAKRVGEDMLRNTTYGNGGYFWADMSDGTNVVLYGDKSVEGTNRANAEMNGMKYMQRILAAGQQPGGGYADYWYPKKGQTTPLAKRSYSLYFAPFDWVVGTGYYVSDIR